MLNAKFTCDGTSEFDSTDRDHMLLQLLFNDATHVLLSQVHKTTFSASNLKLEGLVL